MPLYRSVPPIRGKYHTFGITAETDEAPTVRRFPPSHGKHSPLYSAPFLKPGIKFEHRTPRPRTGRESSSEALREQDGFFTYRYPGKACPVPAVYIPQKDTGCRCLKAKGYGVHRIDPENAFAIKDAGQTHDAGSSHVHNIPVSLH